MQAIVMAGGLGTRLRPFTITIPKPLLPLGDKPIIDILLAQLHQAGFTKVKVCLGFMASLFQNFLGDGSRHGLTIDYVLEEKPLGTAGALRTISDLEEDFLVLNGDTLTDLNFGALLEAHKSAGVYGTICTAKIDEFVDYGVVEFDSETQHLIRYIEKPTRHYHVSTGIYGLSKRILDFAVPDESGRLDMPDLFRTAASKGRPILCYTQENAYWRDIGRFDHYEAASKDYQENPGRFLRAPSRQ